MSTIYRHRVISSQVKQVQADEQRLSEAVRGPATLAPGATGPQVEALQRLLRGIGASDGTVNGTYDAQTQAAVLRLQSAKHLSPTGIVGAAELKALEGQQLDVKGSFNTFAREGEKGADIRSAQLKLKALGFDPGRTDGAFNNGTLLALRRFRRSDPNVPDHGDAFTPTVLNGLNGNIHRVERELKLAGEQPGKIDHTYDANTQAAVRDFQKKHHLQPTGLADAQTRHVLARAAAGTGRSPHVKPSQFQHGYDASMWQSQAEFNAALNKRGTRFMGVKATDGSGWVDPTFKARWAEMGRTLRPGKLDLRIAYHFLEPGNGRAQANHFLNTVGVRGKLKPGTRLALDWEGAALGSTRELKDAAKRIHEVTGTWPLVYASASEVGRAKAAVPHAPVWNAHYSPDKSDFKNPFVQTGGSGLDTDVFTGTELALQKWAGWL